MAILIIHWHVDQNVWWPNNCICQQLQWKIIAEYHVLFMVHLGSLALDETSINLGFHSFFGFRLMKEKYKSINIETIRLITSNYILNCL